MAASNINRVIITGNLTRDPELRSTGSGMAICSLRVANNTRRKDASGEWSDYANYFDVTIFGRTGENAAQYLSKGRPVAIDGSLRWREFTDKEGNKRQAVEIIADNVQFLGGREDGGGGGGGGGGGYGGGQSGGFTPRSDIPVDTGDFAAAPAGGGSNGHATPADDDIPF